MKNSESFLDGVYLDVTPPYRAPDYHIVVVGMAMETNLSYSNFSELELDARQAVSKCPRRFCRSQCNSER